VRPAEDVLPGISAITVPELVDRISRRLSTGGTRRRSVKTSHALFSGVLLEVHAEALRRHSHHELSRVRGILACTVPQPVEKHKQGLLDGVYMSMIVCVINWVRQPVPWVVCG
jgi:hypothetical protein